MPTWLQCVAKRIKDIEWTEIKQYDLFIGVLKGSDGHVNHAIGIFNNWIFDSNEKCAIPLCQEGLNYCVSTVDEKVKFLAFNDGFYFRENAKNNRLKRKIEGEHGLNLSKFARKWSIKN